MPGVLVHRADGIFDPFFLEDMECFLQERHSLGNILAGKITNGCGAVRFKLWRVGEPQGTFRVFMGDCLVYRHWANITPGSARVMLKDISFIVLCVVMNSSVMWRTKGHSRIVAEAVRA